MSRLAKPNLIIVLLVGTAALCLAMLVFVQQNNSAIVNRHMETAISFSEIAARFDRENGEIYRLLVLSAMDDERGVDPQSIVDIQNRLGRIKTDIERSERLLDDGERVRARAVSDQIDLYRRAVGAVGSASAIDFASEAAMLEPFRANADRIVSEVRAIAAAGVADAQFQAQASARRTWALAAVVTVAVLVVAFFCYVWLSVASKRGRQLRDEMARRGEAEREALLLARTDPLTGLFNRRVFNKRLKDAIGSTDGAFAVMLLDLDGFKDANDAHGHAAGDVTLVAVADRLRMQCGPDDVIARLGGDEFAILARGDVEEEELVERARQICAVTAGPVPWQDRFVQIGASIGIARYPIDGVTPDALLHCADLAMYQIKRGFKGDACLFSPSMETERTRQRQMKDELRIGVDTGQFVPFYQPIMRFSDGSRWGVEMLARWRHPRLGMLTPDAFIRLADDANHITALTMALVQTACRDLEGAPALGRIAVNISPSQLTEDGFAERLMAVIHAGGVDPARFEIEVTEDAVLEDARMVERAMSVFRSYGMTVALDDFGTGYSSLSNLHRLRFDKIKVDRTFVSSLGTSRESRKLVEAVIGLAEGLDMEVTAEGIEDGTTGRTLAEMGCHFGQGYHFGRPVCDPNGVRPAFPAVAGIA